MMDPADSVFVGLLALLYSALSATWWVSEPAPTDPYRFLETSSAGRAANAPVKYCALCPEDSCGGSSVPGWLPEPTLDEGGLRLGELTILGSVPRTLVVERLSAQLPALEACVGDASGAVVVKLVVNREGEILRVQPIEQAPGLDEVADCVAAGLGAAHFPPGPGLFIVKQTVRFGD